MFYPMGNMTIVDTEDDKSNMFVKRLIFDVLAMAEHEGDVKARTSYVKEYAEALKTLVDDIGNRHVEFMFTKDGEELWLKKHEFDQELNNGAKFEGKFRLTGTPLVVNNKQLKGIQFYIRSTNRPLFLSTLWDGLPADECNQMLDRIMVRS